MTPQLPPDAIRKLLGGYATGTLTSAEQAALFAAALEDQELFDALASEQALRDHLRDPVAHAQLLAALAPPPRASFWQWLRSPVVAGLVTAGIAAIAIVAVWQSTRVPPVKQPPPMIIAEALPPQTPPAGARLATEASRDAAPARSDAAESRSAALRPKMLSAAKESQPVPATSSLDAEALKKEVDRLVAAAPPPPPAAAPSAIAAATQTVEVTATMSAALVEGADKKTAGTLSNSPLRVNGFAAGGTAKAFAPVSLRCTVLRDSGEVDPSIPLSPSETIRLRIVPSADGTLSVTESGKVLATAPVHRQQPFDTQPLPFTGTGTRQISLTFSAAAPAAPFVVPITLTYRQ
jgi:hypothetical protein